MKNALLLLFALNFSSAAFGDSFRSRERLHERNEWNNDPRRSYVRSITKKAVARLSKKYGLAFSPLVCDYDGRGEECDFKSNAGDLCHSWAYLEVVALTGEYSGTMGATVICYSSRGQRKEVEFDLKAPGAVLR